MFCITLVSQVPLVAGSGATPEAPDASAGLFGAAVEGKDQGDAAAAWLSRVLGGQPRLLRRVQSCRRTAAGRHWADIAPLLVISTASLAALCEAAQRAISMDRFRPNIVLESSEPHAEDQWPEMRIGDLRLQRLGPCGRCSIVEVAQGLGQRRTLSLFDVILGAICLVFACLCYFYSTNY